MGLLTGCPPTCSSSHRCGRARPCARYLEQLAVDVAMSEQRAVAMGGLVHGTFFVRRHTTAIEKGWGSLPEYGDLIVRRVQQVASQA